eukprot:jgi/Mesen1/4592/ME000232S03853
MENTHGEISSQASASQNGESRVPGGSSTPQQKQEGWTFEPRLEWRPEVEEYLKTAFGAEHFSRICDALVRPPVNLCLRVNTLQASTADVIAELNAQLQQQQGELKELAPQSASKADGPSGASGQLSIPPSADSVPPAAATLTSADATRGDHLTGPPGPPPGPMTCREHPSLKDVIIVDGTGPHAVSYSDEGGGHDAIKEVVVSRNPALEEGDAVGVSFVIERPDDRGGFGLSITRGAILGSEHAHSQMGGVDRTRWFIGRGRALMSRAALFREPRGVAVHMLRRVFELPPFSGMMQGRVFLQNLPSIVAARVLDPQPGERVLDMCAAPGGKTTAIATLMRNQGEVIACDRSHTKVKDIADAAREMGLTCIKPYKLNSLRAVLRRSSQPAAPSSAAPPAATLSSLDSGQETATYDPHAPAQPPPPGAEPAGYHCTAAVLAQPPTVGSAGLPGVVHAPEAALQVEQRPDGRSHMQPDIAELELGPDGETGASEAPAGVPAGVPSAAPAGEAAEGPAGAPVGGGGAGAGDHRSRVAARKAKRRARLTGSTASEADGLTCRMDKSDGFEARSFDRVLLDAPCSALGLRPRLFAGQVTLEDLRSNAVYQRRLLDQAVQLVKPGGVLVYSTCTLNPGENEGLVRYALDTYPFLVLSPQEPRLGGPGLVGGKDVFDSVGYREWLRVGEEHLVQRFDPCGPHDTIAFFIAKFLVRDP